MKKYNFPIDHNKLKQFENEIYNPTEKMLSDDLLYNRINGLYTEIEDVGKKDFDRSDRNRQIIVGEVLGNLELSMRNYLEARTYLKEKKALVKKEKKSGSEKLVEAYQSIPAPLMLSDLKKMATKIKGWKVVATRDIYMSKWNLSIDDDRYNNRNMIFRNPPLDVSAYQKKYMIIDAAITRKLDGQFVISPNNGSDEAIAKISRSTISNSAARFNQSMMILCRLLDVIEAQTVGGGTKAISVLEVVTMVPSEYYNKFSKYVAGHPKEFPQKKYIKIEIPG